MALPACGFAVYADKGGQLPLAIERRAKGKRVTIINGVKGNARALCQSLTSLLGVGGTVHSKGQFFDVEVQGEQTERVSSALRQLACVRGPGGVKLKEPAVVERGCAYDEFLRQEEAPNGRRKERWEAGLRCARYLGSLGSLGSIKNCFFTMFRVRTRETLAHHLLNSVPIYWIYWFLDLCSSLCSLQLRAEL